MPPLLEPRHNYISPASYKGQKMSLTKYCYVQVSLAGSDSNWRASEASKTLQGVPMEIVTETWATVRMSFEARTSVCRVSYRGGWALEYSPSS